MPPELALLSTLTGSNYPCLELFFMVHKVFEPLKFDCISNRVPLKVNVYTFMPLSLLTHKQIVQRAFGAKMTSDQRRCDVITSHQR